MTVDTHIHAGVILTEGRDGVLPPCFFDKVTDRHGVHLLHAQTQTPAAEQGGAA